MALTLIAFFICIFMFIPYILKFISNCHENLDYVFNALKSLQLKILRIGLVVISLFWFVGTIIWAGSSDCCENYENEKNLQFGISCYLSITWYLVFFPSIIMLFLALYVWIAWNGTNIESYEAGGEGYSTVE